jgi:hypothetical protein
LQTDEAARCRSSGEIWRLISERLIPSRGGSVARWIRRREAVALFEKSRLRKTVSITRNHDFGLVNVLYYWAEGEEEPGGW